MCLHLQKSPWEYRLAKVTVSKDQKGCSEAQKLAFPRFCCTSEQKGIIPRAYKKGKLLADTLPILKHTIAETSREILFKDFVKEMWEELLGSPN